MQFCIDQHGLEVLEDRCLDLGEEVEHCLLSASVRQRLLHAPAEEQTDCFNDVRRVGALLDSVREAFTDLNLPGDDRIQTELRPEPSTQMHLYLLGNFRLIGDDDGQARHSRQQRFPRIDDR